MQILTCEHAAQWCAVHGLDVDARFRPHWSDPRLRNCLKYATKGSHSVAEAFARNVVSCASFDGAIVWLTDWPLYKADEMAVVVRLRQSVGDDRNLIAASAHVFAADEADDCVGLFNLCRHYCFDAFLYVPSSGLLAYTSHDEIEYISALDQSYRDELAKGVHNYDLRLLNNAV